MYVVTEVRELTGNNCFNENYKKIIGKTNMLIFNNIYKEIDTLPAQHILIIQEFGNKLKKRKN